MAGTDEHLSDNDYGQRPVIWVCTSSLRSSSGTNQFFPTKRPFFANMVAQVAAR